MSSALCHMACNQWRYFCITWLVTNGVRHVAKFVSDDVRPVTKFVSDDVRHVRKFVSDDVNHVPKFAARDVWSVPHRWYLITLTLYQRLVINCVYSVTYELCLMS